MVGLAEVVEELAGVVLVAEELVEARHELQVARTWARHIELVGVNTRTELMEGSITEDILSHSR